MPSDAARQTYVLYYVFNVDIKLPQITTNGGMGPVTNKFGILQVLGITIHQSGLVWTRRHFYGPVLTVSVPQN